LPRTTIGRSNDKRPDGRSAVGRELAQGPMPPAAAKAAQLVAVAAVLAATDKLADQGEERPVEAASKLDRAEGRERHDGDAVRHSNPALDDVPPDAEWEVGHHDHQVPVRVEQLLAPRIDDLCERSRRVDQSVDDELCLPADRPVRSRKVLREVIGDLRRHVLGEPGSDDNAKDELRAFCGGCDLRYDLISILLRCSFSAFGIRTVRTPSSRWASTLSLLTSAGKTT
jgi:hypothetical protein